MSNDTHIGAQISEQCRIHTNHASENITLIYAYNLFVYFKSKLKYHKFNIDNFEFISETYDR